MNPEPGTRPNILLITTDQQHYGAIGYNNRHISTPALDALAAGGTILDRAYCPNPLCSPSRSSIITGRYPSAHGCWTIGTKLDEETETVGDILGAAGYATSLIGKAHFQPLASTPDQISLECPPTLRDLEFWREFHGPYYGFDHIELARNHGDEAWAGQHYALWLLEQGATDWPRYFRTDNAEPGRRHRWDLPEELHYSTWTAERTIAELERASAADEPFFCWASFQDPHPPYLVPEPWDTMYDPADVEIGTLEPGELDAMPPWYGLTQQPEPDFTPWQETPFTNHGFSSHLISEADLRRNVAVYYGMISLIDRNVGRILARLDELGLADDTLVIFTTDHGHYLGQHGLNAKGSFLYEDLLRIPFVVRYPGRVPAGRRASGLCSLVDLAPTFLSLAGLPVAPLMQGVDQLGVWSGEAESARDHVFVENRHQPTVLHSRSYVDQRYKLSLHRGGWGELFDLVDDPGERRNRYADPAWADLREELFARLVEADMARERSRYPRIAVA